MSLRPRLRAQANGVAHVLSPGRLVAAPRRNKNPTIFSWRSAGSPLWHERTASARGVPQNSTSRELMSAPASRKTAAAERSPFSAQAWRNV